MIAVSTQRVDVGAVSIGGGGPLALIAGPCVLERRESSYALAQKLRDIAASAGVPLIFKASYDKANRTSLGAFRGPGFQEGLEVLRSIRDGLGLPVLSDVHRFEEIAPAAEILDVIQVPAFLCRQTDLVVEVARTGKAVNIKKGQFLAPRDIGFVVEKVVSTGNRRLLITERGTSFGYNNLVVDMRALAMMRDFGYPIVFDATHSVQLPGGLDGASGGERRYVAPLARAAAAVGIDAVFLEVHENPDQALCDGPNSLPLSELSALLGQLVYVSKSFGVGAD